MPTQPLVNIDLPQRCSTKSLFYLYLFYLAHTCNSGLLAAAVFSLFSLHSETNLNQFYRVACLWSCATLVLTRFHNVSMCNFYSVQAESITAFLQNNWHCQMTCPLSRLWLCPLDGCRGASLRLAPHSFLFRSTSFSAEQPHSHSSSLSSIELVSASDDIHRFSTQVLHLFNSEHLYLQRAENAYCFSVQRACTDRWECLLTSLSRISEVFPVLSLEYWVNIKFLHQSFDSIMWKKSYRTKLKFLEWLLSFLYYIAVAFIPEKNNIWLESSLSKIYIFFPNITLSSTAWASMYPELCPECILGMLTYTTTQSRKSLIFH